MGRRDEFATDVNLRFQSPDDLGELKDHLFSHHRDSYFHEQPEHQANKDRRGWTAARLHHDDLHGWDPLGQGHVHG